ncbi:MAG: ATP-binding protein [Bacteroidota bacterium]
MAKHFAQKYKTEFVPEVSREFISTNDFTIEDIIRIGQAQTDRVIQKSKIANRILFCDTDVITTEIYCRHYLKDVPGILFELEHSVRYDQYFLFEIDVPWVPMVFVILATGDGRCLMSSKPSLTKGIFNMK